jgi:hypothetical protein
MPKVSSVPVELESCLVALEALLKRRSLAVQKQTSGDQDVRTL